MGVDRGATTGLREQVESGLRQAIRDGRLRTGARLPSSRALAADLGVARGVVVEAYDQLVAEGYLTARRGSGTVVAATAGTEAVPAPRPDTAGSPAPAPAPTRPRYDFRPGHPDLSAFPRAAWLRATREALRDLADADLGYGDSRGLPGLRALLAAHLARIRGVQADPDRMVITNGFAQGLSLIADALLRRGGTEIGTEDPGHPGPRRLLTHAGLRCRPLEIDGEGLQVGRLGTVPAVLVTPAHQFPSGVVLSPERRGALIEWARTGGGVVIEDDYDAEYRFDREPVGALQGLAPEHVIYAGSLSKSLVPALRLGWLILPAGWDEEVMRTKSAADPGTSTVLQATLLRLLGSGALDRHLRRTRRLYRERRATLAAALARHAPDVRLVGPPAGMHAVVRLPSGTDEAEVERRAAAVSVGVYGMRRYRSTCVAGPGELVLGYGALSVGEIEAGVALLGQILNDLHRIAAR